MKLVQEQITARCAGFDLDGRAVIIGVNGLDAAGNGSFARGLKTSLATGEKNVVVLHLDDFADHRVRETFLKAPGGDVPAPEVLLRYYEDGTDYAAVRRAIRESAEDADFVIAEGVFLYTDALSDLFDIKTYLDVDQAQVRERCAPDCKAPFDALLLPAFELYKGEYEPAATSDLVIDYNEPSKPRIVSAVG